MISATECAALRSREGPLRQLGRDPEASRARCLRCNPQDRPLSSGGGLALDKSYSLPPVNFTTREAALLVTAGRWLERTRLMPFVETLRSAIATTSTSMTSAAFEIVGERREAALLGVTNRVKKMVTPYRSPVKLEVARDGTPATALGGPVVLLEFLAAKRVAAALPESDGSPPQGWSNGQMILVVLFLDVPGLTGCRPSTVWRAMRGFVRWSGASRRSCSACRGARPPGATRAAPINQSGTTPDEAARPQGVGEDPTISKMPAFPLRKSLLQAPTA